MPPDLSPPPALRPERPSSERRSLRQRIADRRARRRERRAERAHQRELRAAERKVEREARRAVRAERREHREVSAQRGERETRRAERQRLRRERRARRRQARTERRERRRERRQVIDLATANDQSFTVMLGDGMGGVAASVLFDIGIASLQADTGDFDGDGLIDVAVGYGKESMGLLRSEQRGALSLVIAEPQPTLNHPRSVAVGDLDGHGLDDIVAGSFADQGGIAVLIADP